MKKISQLLREPSSTRAKNLSTEFQVYGAYIAETLDDLKRCSLYIKLAKQYPRALLEEALNYTKGYYSAKSKAKIFMWKLQQLKTVQKEEGFENPSQ